MQREYNNIQESETRTRTQEIRKENEIQEKRIKETYKRREEKEITRKANNIQQK